MRRSLRVNKNKYRLRSSGSVPVLDSNTPSSGSHASTRKMKKKSASTLKVEEKDEISAAGTNEIEQLFMKLNTNQENCSHMPMLAAVATVISEELRPDSSVDLDVSKFKEPKEEESKVAEQNMSLKMLLEKQQQLGFDFMCSQIQDSEIRDALLELKELKLANLKLEEYVLRLESFRDLLRLITPFLSAQTPEHRG